MASRLTDVASIERYRHVALDEVGSTNTYALEKARDGDPGLLWVTARRQTSGRGRRNRPWVSEPGNLYASLLLIDIAADMSALASLPLAAALAVHDAVSAEFAWAPERVRIKWPNDILLDGKKLCGILLEGEKLPDGRHAVVIGCGVNIVHKPDSPLYPTTTLAEAGISIDADGLLARFMVAFAEVLALWDGGRGVAKVVSRWSEAIAGVSKPITANLPDRSVSGIFAGVEPDGRLRLRLESGDDMLIASGDVFFS
jgi:BirA family biotin operon repressor/biotin-[acetyl-CoA-carboxylase] ligase